MVERKQPSQMCQRWAQSRGNDENNSGQPEIPQSGLYFSPQTCLPAGRDTKTRRKCGSLSYVFLKNKTLVTAKAAFDVYDSGEAGNPAEAG
jgi:hypothetical protein